jgi:pyruvate ferredoxin oxidoreductase alpha subunit
VAVTESEILAVTGNEAVAEAMGQIDPDVVCAYPITPQTEVVQLYAQMVAGPGTPSVDAAQVWSEPRSSVVAGCEGPTLTGLSQTAPQLRLSPS